MFSFSILLKEFEIRKENFKKFRDKQGIISRPENIQEVLPIPMQAWGKNLKPGAAAATFLTLPVDGYNFGEEASVDRKGAAAHTDGIKAHDLMFGVSADDTRGGGSWKVTHSIENWEEGFRQTPEHKSIILQLERRQ